VLYFNKEYGFFTALTGRFVEEGYFPVLSELEFQTNLTRIQVLKITGT
jgi:hypothetical protein